MPHNKSTMQKLDNWTCQRKWIYKSYHINHLLDSDWSARVAIIERWSKERPYPVRFHLDGETLIRLTRKLPAVSKKIRRPTQDQIQAISSQLASLHGKGLTHGDVNAKNIWWDGKEAVLLDMEPSLLQLNGDRPCLMGTAPMIHPLDRSHHRLSALSDQLGFVMWAYETDLKTASAMAEAGKNWNELSQLNF